MVGTTMLAKQATAAAVSPISQSRRSPLLAAHTRSNAITHPIAANFGRTMLAKGASITRYSIYRETEGGAGQLGWDKFLSVPHCHLTAMYPMADSREHQRNHA
jgi:hypothetical protein